jgi:P27 family predicted phage terminase small subunit
MLVSMPMRAPSHLSPTSRKLWRRIADDYFSGQGEDTALLVLTAMLEAKDRCDQARVIIEAEGLVVPTGTGSVKPHPAVNIEKEARLQLIRAARELGLDPDGAS